MDRSKARPASSGARNVSHTFERTRPQPGRRSGSYSRNVSSPKALREERQQLYLIFALLVLLPPVGVALLWRGGFLRLAYRTAATCAAFLLLILYFSWMLPEKKIGTIAPDIKRPAAVTEYSPSSSKYTRTDNG